ncbi:MAG: dihydroorotase, partial [Bdellovibrionales bacterium]
MNNFDLILKNAHCVVPQNNSTQLKIEKLDIGIRQGLIAEISSSISPHLGPVQDLTGLHVLPGLIDTQVHFREPGMTYKEDIESGSRSAVFGGLTGFFEMPNTKPPTTSLEALQHKFDLAHHRSHTHYAFYGGSLGENFFELNRQENHPHSPGIKIFMGTSTGGYLVDKDEVLIEILKNTRRRLVVHCEEEEVLRARASLLQQNPHPRLHPVWRNEESALRATQRIIKHARSLGRKVHILHVTTAEEVDFLRDQKDVATFEVLPQHLLLTAPECYEALGTLAQMNPPIRGFRHQQALWRAVNDGSVTMMGSDHAPHTLQEKAKPYPQSPSGIPGVQTFLPLMLNFVNQGRLRLERLVELMAHNPAQVFRIKNKGLIKKGFDADFSIVDLKKTCRIDNRWIQSKCGYTPYHGMQVQGWPHSVVLMG